MCSSSQKNYNQNQVHIFRELVHIPQILNTGPQKWLQYHSTKVKEYSTKCYKMHCLFDPLLSHVPQAPTHMAGPSISRYHVSNLPIHFSDPYYLTCLGGLYNLMGNTLK